MPSRTPMLPPRSPEAFAIATRRFPRAPTLPGARARRRAWLALSAVATSSAALWVSVGANVACLFICGSCSLMLSALNRERTG